MKKTVTLNCAFTGSVLYALILNFGGLLSWVSCLIILALLIISIIKLIRHQPFFDNFFKKGLIYLASFIIFVPIAHRIAEWPLSGCQSCFTWEYYTLDYILWPIVFLIDLLIIDKFINKDIKKHRWLKLILISIIVFGIVITAINRHNMNQPTTYGTPSLGCDSKSWL